MMSTGVLVQAKSGEKVGAVDELRLTRVKNFRVTSQIYHLQFNFHSSEENASLSTILVYSRRTARSQIALRPQPRR